MITCSEIFDNAVIYVNIIPVRWGSYEPFFHDIFIVSVNCWFVESAFWGIKTTPISSFYFPLIQIHFVRHSHNIPSIFSVKYFNAMLFSNLMVCLQLWIWMAPQSLELENLMLTYGHFHVCLIGESHLFIQDLRLTDHKYPSVNEFFTQVLFTSLFRCSSGFYSTVVREFFVVKKWKQHLVLSFSWSSFFISWKSKWCPKIQGRDG